MTKRTSAVRVSIISIGILSFLFIGAVSARFLYHKLRGPAVYKPNGQIAYITPITTPISAVPNNQSVKPREPGSKALLKGAKWVPQSFNNCGPATTSMVLQYFGFDVNQNETKAKLRTNADDKNVFTDEMAAYMKKDYGVESKLLYGGDIAMLKKLIANGFYVVVEDWLHPNEDIGHVTIIRGFDDEQKVLIADDSFIGINITYPYEEFMNTQWKAFNYEYLPVYTAGNEKLLQAIVGEAWEESVMFERTAQAARNQIAENENDMYAWFNLGSSLYGLGHFEEARLAFEKSRSIGWPKRMLWYQLQPIQTYNALALYDKARELADVALWSNDSFAEAHVEKAIAYKGLGNIEKAREEVQTALRYAPNLTKALDFLASL